MVSGANWKIIQFQSKLSPSQLSFLPGQRQSADTEITGGFHRRRRTTRDTKGPGLDQAQLVRLFIIWLLLLLFGNYYYYNCYLVNLTSNKFVPETLNIIPTNKKSITILCTVCTVSVQCCGQKQIVKINFISGDVGPVFYYITGKHT